MSLAKLYAVLAHGGEVGGVRLLSPQTLEKIAVVHSRGPDLVLVLPMGWRLGYHSAFTTRGTVPGAFGHFGFGGSGGWADPQRDLALAMVCNRGTGTSARRPADGRTRHRRRQGAGSVRA